MNDRSRQLVLDLPQRSAMGREDFLVAPSNKAAVALIDQWPNWPSYGAIIVGPPGSGKTHLGEVLRQQSMGNQAQNKAQDTVLIIDEADAMFAKRTDVENANGRFDALETNDLLQNAEKELFHLLNVVKQSSRHVLILAQTPPSEWNLSLPDLVSRLDALPVINILSPDDALLRGVLVKLFTDRQINIDEATISYMILRMPRSLQSARGIVNEIDRQAMIEKAEITRPFVAKVLANFNNPDMFEVEN